MEFTIPIKMRPAGVDGKERKLDPEKGMSEEMYLLSLVTKIGIEAPNQNEAERAVDLLGEAVATFSKMRANEGLWLVFGDIESMTDFEYGLQGVFTSEYEAVRWIDDYCDLNNEDRRQFTVHGLGQPNPEAETI